MKKIVAFLLLSVLLINAVAISVSAAVTADDVITELSKNPVFHYVEADIRNLARTYKFTSDEYSSLLDVAKEANTVITKDLGYASESYDKATIKKIADLAYKACDIIGFKIVITNASSAKHTGDILFSIYDRDGKLAFVYDGDVVKSTASADMSVSANTTLNAVLAVVGVVAAAGLAVVALRQRKENY